MATEQFTSNEPGLPQVLKHVPISRAATYMLTIEPQGGTSAHFKYVFPMSPQQLNVDRRSYNTYYDVSGRNSDLGVQREMDEYGTAPPIFTVTGTTGWNALPNTGFKIGGLQAFKDLNTFLDLYTNLNMTAVKTGGVTYKLAFLDFWYNEYWYVSTVGDIKRTQNANQPSILNYQMTFVGYAPVNGKQVSDSLDTYFKDQTYYPGNIQALPSTIGKSLTQVRS